MMQEILNPEYRFSSLEKITPEWLCRHHYRVLLLDLDNTLLDRNSSIVPEQHLKWLLLIQRHGIVVLLASNNGGKRVEAIEKQITEMGLHIPILTWAGKPFPRAYAGAVRLLKNSFPEVAVQMENNPESVPDVGMTPANGGISDVEKEKHSGLILAVGDQLFTDVLGAHWYKLPVALLTPLSQNDFIGTKVLRVLERGVIWLLKKEGTFPEEDSVDS